MRYARLTDSAAVLILHRSLLRPAAFFRWPPGPCRRNLKPYRRCRLAFLHHYPEQLAGQSRHQFHSNCESDGFAKYLRILLTPERTDSAAHALGGCAIRIPYSAFDVVHIVRQTLAEGIKYLKPRIEQNAKGGSRFRNLMCMSPDDSFADIEMQKPGGMLASVFAIICGPP
jgi:hypothetical protein